MTYKELVCTHLQPLLDRGMRRHDVADKLGLESPNMVSMVMSPRYKTLLPLRRIPALSALVGLTACQSLVLVKHLVASSEAKKVELDMGTFRWLVRCIALVLQERRGGR